MVNRTERQSHGFIFQDWIISKFLDMAYTAKWDIPRQINPISHKPVSIKTALYGSSVGLGDALSQFRINEDFQLLVAFYKVEGEIKKVVNIQLIDISLEKWKELWGSLTEEKLLELDKLIKSQEGRRLSNEHLEDFRNKIGQKKLEIVNKFPSKISLHPKIDSKNQRRLQCSIPFNILFEEFNLDKKPRDSYNLWGEDIKLKNIPLN